MSLRGALSAFAMLAACSAAAAQTAEPPAGAAACSGCHASSGNVQTPVLRLTGIDAAQIITAMREFKSGTRAGTIMDRIAKGFGDDEIRAIAAWYAAQK